MTAKILDGSKLAEKLFREKLLPRIKTLKKTNILPHLQVIYVGKNDASDIYITKKKKFAKKCGIKCSVLKLPVAITEKELLTRIVNFNNDKNIHGIIVQLPVPSHISVQKIWNTIAKNKDVDGFCPANIGKLLLGETPCMTSCTPKGICTLLEENNINLMGKNITILGSSNIVGKPMAALAVNKGATVSLCHRKTKNIREICAHADIIIVAIGQKQFITAKDIPSDKVLIDVGSHYLSDKKSTGDIAPETFSSANFYSPVPGGVGPMTIYSLMENTIFAAENHPNFNK